MSYENSERTSVFIDGSSLYYASRSLGFEVDFRDLRMFLAHEIRKHRQFPSAPTKLIQAYYYAAMPDDQEYSPVRPLTDWLSYNGYSVITKTQRAFTDSTGRRRLKGDTNVEIAIDMLERSAHLDHIILISGDADLRRAVEAVQNKGVRVTVISTKKGGTSIISDELRRQADEFIDLDDICSSFRKTNVVRPPETGKLEEPFDE